MHTIQLLNLFFLACLTGGWMVWATVVASTHKQLSASAYAEAEKNNKAIGRVYFPVLFVCTVITFIILILQGIHPSGSFQRSITSLVLVAAMAGFTAMKVLPLNKKMMNWDSANPPSDWAAVRDRWHRYHRIRTVIMVVAFLLQSSSIIWQ